MFRSASSKPSGRAWVLTALPPGTALLAALITMALLLVIGAQPAAAQEQPGGTVVGWGNNESGQSTVPESARSGVKAIAAGEQHSLALKQDGSVVGWGSNTYGQTTVPTGAQSGVKAIAAGYVHSLALYDVTPPAGVEFLDADAGDERVSLSWDDPQDFDFTATRVLRSTTGVATDPEPSATQSIAYEGDAEAFVDTDLQNGTTYYYTAFATDDGDNWSARSVSRATPRDATAPETTITSSGPQRLSNSASATFQFTSTEAGSAFECSLDDAPFAGCASGKTYKDLNDGFHIFEVRATDAAGNVEPAPARQTWTVDKITPGVTGVGPMGTRVSPTANVTATFSEAMDAVTIDGTTFKLFKMGTTTAIGAALTYDPATKKAVLNPNANLKRGAKYKAVVTTGARDLAGNTLDQNPTLSGAQPKQWSFTVKN